MTWDLNLPRGSDQVTNWSQVAWKADPTPPPMKLAFLATLATAAARNASFVRTPGGLVREGCIISVENGARVDGVAFAQDCSPPSVSRTEQIYAMNTAAQKPSYWSNFTADWVVPALPSKASGQVVYFWPGFKADEPVMGYPVLQPVLQYGQSGSHWELQSWFVHGGAVTAPAIRVAPGDRLTSYMSFDAESDDWTVYGKDLDTGKESKLTISKRARAYKTVSLAPQNMTTRPCLLPPPAARAANGQLRFRVGDARARDNHGRERLLRGIPGRRNARLRKRHPGRRSSVVGHDRHQDRLLAGSPSDRGG